MKLRNKLSQVEVGVWLEWVKLRLAKAASRALAGAWQYFHFFSENKGEEYSLQAGAELSQAQDSFPAKH